MTTSLGDRSQKSPLKKCDRIFNYSGAVTFKILTSRSKIVFLIVNNRAEQLAVDYLIF
ncbi:hypothetical protein [Nostoc sp.]|uniref:hypothetical protein n=1 Tax=Nostoc sp. TaxID=1180 RepID=UPI002FF6845E